MIERPPPRAHLAAVAVWYLVIAWELVRWLGWELMRWAKGRARSLARRWRRRR